MSLTETPVCNFGEKIKEFKLISTEDTFISLKDIKGQNGTLIMFICNHCPYVKAVIKELVDVTNKISNFGINSVAIMSNDANNYPEDSFENMKKFLKTMGRYVHLIFLDIIKIMSCNIAVELEK
jgi:peroxiredoxin